MNESMAGRITKLLCMGLFITGAFLTPATYANSADFKTGYRAYQRGDFAAAAKEWLALAEAGNTKAQYNVGILFDQGKGVQQDRAEAVSWWRRSAESG
ncbi:MAG: sel1 repeat family protein, partial [Rhodospirillaceae bacterium]|nr:sel1 repeat family protein [Rhodospirillaceae bacterium]